MNKEELIKTIVGFIPSETVKKKVEETHHVFDEADLIQIVILYAPDHAKRLETLQELYHVIKRQKLKKYVAAYVQEQIDAYERLTGKEDGYIYEVNMDSENAYEERYLVADYPSCFSFIDAYRRVYADVLEEHSIVIRKRKLLRDPTDEDVEERERTEATFDHSGRLLRVEGNYIDDSFGVIKYPHVFQRWDCVRILCENRRYDWQDAHEYALAVYEGGGDEITCLYYIDDEYVRRRCAVEGINVNVEHAHEDCGILEYVDPDTLGDELKGNYEYLKAEMKKLG